jgi:hypothetical protein
MEFVQNKLACSHCVKILQSPITLPCGETICKHHVNELEKKYHCDSCGENHPIPKKGFQVNKIVEDMLQSKISSLHFGEEYQSAADALNSLEDLLKNCHLLRQDLNSEIDEVINDLKGNIDLKREQLKLEIDKEADKLIRQVDDYKNECKKKVKKFNFKQLDKKVKRIEAEVEKSKNELSVLVIDKQKWSVIKETLENHSNELNDQFSSVRDELFLSELDQFTREMNVFLRNTSSR